MFACHGDLDSPCMIILARTVRFAINPDGSTEGANGYAGVPTMSGLGRHYEITVKCRGTVHEKTGYFLNIKEIDRAVRTAAIPVIADACRTPSARSPSAVLIAIWPGVNSSLGGSVQSITWNLSPYYCLEMTRTDPGRVLLRQRFEFAASHRLHTPSLSDAENRALFGRCNNPSGHGHNYIVEPCIACDPDAPKTFGLLDLEKVVLETVIDRFDHMHLNIDTPEFKTGAGMNPSVENISRACYDILKPAVAKASGGTAELRSVTVWETEKTSATYPA